MDTMMSLKEERDGLLIVLADLQAENDRRVAELAEENAALRVRAEAAGAECDALREELDALEEDRNIEAILLADELNDARAVELEAAAGWRPVTEQWPPPDERVLIAPTDGTWWDVARRRRDIEGEEVWALDDGTVLDFESAGVATRVTLPPFPSEEAA